MAMCKLSQDIIIMDRQLHLPPSFCTNVPLPRSRTYFVAAAWRRRVARGHAARPPGRPRRCGRCWRPHSAPTPPPHTLASRTSRPGITPTLSSFLVCINCPLLNSRQGAQRTSFICLIYGHDVFGPSNYVQT